MPDMSNQANFQIHNEEIEKVLRELAKFIDKDLPSGWGFTLLLFEFDPGNSLFYISNAQQEHMLKAMREFIARNTQ
jgi:hypothetical protein